jgi:methylenetetrahydrofolate reductase (NADPH)
MPDSTYAGKNPISTLLAKSRSDGRQTLSFEFYPFRDESSANQLWQTLEKILEAEAHFVSLTYGAGGGSQERSFTVLERLATQIPTIGHLTAVGASTAGTASIIKRYEDLGVASILALRGDSPKDDPTALERGELSTALQLLDVASSVSNLETGVAAFPEKHPESPTLEHDAELLVKKQAAGAKYAITQLFFEVDSYLELLRCTAERGVTLEIIPGLMPIANAKQVIRMAQMSGAAIPKLLLGKLENATENEAKAIGMDFSIELAGKLLDAGAPGLHLFTLNRHEGALQIAREVGLAR